MAAIDGKWLSKEGLTYFWSKIKAIFTKQTETNVIANLGAKNMLYISNAPGYTDTSHGRTFTVLSDGGIKITGASSDNSNADFYVIGSWGNRSILLNENKDSCLIRMACDTDYEYSQIRFRVMNRSTGSTVNDTGVETNKDVKLSHAITTVFVSVFPSVTLPEDGIVVYPMIRRAEITDGTFQPYAPSNCELYETKTEQTETNVIANLGAKNLLKNVRTTTTHKHKGITFTVNEDGSVTANGTNDGTGASWFNVNTQSTLALDNGDYILTGCPAGGSTTGYLMDITRPPSASLKDTGNGVSFAVGGNYTINEIRIVISRNLTVDNLTFYPMIRRAEITDDTFQPYTPTNRELYETRFASKTILPDNVDLNNIKTGGIYNGVNSTGNSAVHMPVATGSFNFVLTVIEANEFIIQIFKQLNSAGDPNFYVRRFYIYNSDWDSWYQFTGTQV